MGIFFKTNAEKRQEELKANLKKCELSTQEFKIAFDRMSAQQQLAVCHGACLFNKLLQTKFGSLQGLMECDPQEVSEWTIKIQGYMAQNESDRYLWLGMFVGFQWYNALLISTGIDNNEGLAVVDRLWSIFEPLVKRGSQYEP